MCQAEGYERDMLALMYGAVGISFDKNKLRMMEQSGKIQLNDVSDSSSSLHSIYGAERFQSNYRVKGFDEILNKSSQTPV